MFRIENALTSTRKHRRWGRAVSIFTLIVLVAALGLGAWVYAIVRSSLAETDGTLQVAGLSARVTVSRDAQGVPTIYAANLDDLFFAQGFITAQDRLWQMDGMRRFAGGNLAEILGEDLVKHDRKQRILGLRQAAELTLQQFSPEVRSHFEAYARGVNAYIQTHSNKLPFEFRILRYNPQPWVPEDSTLIAAQMVEDLSTPPDQALVREKILAKLGPELTADLFVNLSSHDRPPTVSHSRAEPISDGDDDDEDDSGSDASVASLGEIPRVPFDVDGFDTADTDDRLIIGSNNWVVSGGHTTTGKPLLSNDMHLGHQMPNLWYEAHLRSGNFDAAGITLPGMPYVVVGHNQRIAWGFTNVGPTVEDAYHETFNDDGNYLTPEGWKPPLRRREVIKVKGKADEVLDVVVTRHGPVVNELYPGESRPIALRWTLYDGVRNPFFAVDSAQNWTEFRQAFSQLDAPAQNVVYADVEGNIGYQTTGKIPVRASGDGSLPEDGSTDKFEWTSYIPFDKLPSTFNPPSGIIATANGRVAPDNYPYSISSEWEPPWRTARIYQVLESGKIFSAADMLSLQTDISSEFDRFIANRLVSAVDRSKNAPLNIKNAADILRNWDGRMSASSAAPVIAVRAREALVHLLLAPKLTGDSESESTLNWTSYKWMMRTVWLENVLRQEPKRWLPGGYATYDELLSAALQSTLQDPKLSSNFSSWQWGRVNAVTIQHPILGRIPILRAWAGPGMQPQSGSPYTVKAVSPTHGPSERMTVDLANLDRTTLNVVTGEAGNPLSPYYMDQWKAWYEGFTFSLPYTQNAVARAQAHQLIMEPAH
ncbi:MAG: penicillin acylase family protein [Terriglobales bacterium]